MSGNTRHEQILDRLSRDGRVDVAVLADELDTSEVTIRRDLDHLAQVGVLRRIRGGAVNLMMRGEGLPFAMRGLDASSVKERIAAAVSELIQDGEAVTVDSGTSGAAVARELASRRLTVMPFSVQAIANLSGSTSVTLILPGGTVRADEGSIVGPLAEASLRSLRFDTAVLSCCGLSAIDGVMAYDLQDAAAKQAMIGSARRVITVAEGAKFGRSAMAVVCDPSAIDILVTDDSAPEDALAELRAQGVDVVTVPAH
ncbi:MULTISPECIES: DeoR/GlpR family DNA-binding transcription regulator [unclassified Plantibacter]|uniref:DeoR/GlpR family DNA-binding transcription regulator n=1 Tax=unclassified Plantibacter TaxID=2624265 RepID=UPI003D359A0E